jgi:hypothetical protein
MPEMKDLLESVATLIADYRKGEIATIDAQHVTSWINQFDEDVRKPILTELIHVFGKTYYTKDNVLKFLGAVLTSKKLIGDDPCAFWKSAKFLDIQGGGNSQHEMLELFSQQLKKECGFDIGECGDNVVRFIYLDDALFTGNRIRNDLAPWVNNDAPASADVYVITLGLHSGGHYYANGRIAAAAKAAGKTIKVHWWRAVGIKDSRSETNVSDVLRPTKIPEDELTKSYVAAMQHAPVLRTPGNVGSLGIFSSDEGRSLLEQEFLKAGCRVRSICPHLGVYQRPLGNMVLETLGFGSMIVTFRNCPNNAPLALWAGDPWIPLFPRKTN